MVLNLGHTWRHLGTFPVVSSGADAMGVQRGEAKDTGEHLIRHGTPQQCRLDQAASSLRLRDPVLKTEVQARPQALARVLANPAPPREAQQVNPSKRSEALDASLTWRRRKQPPRCPWKCHWPRRSPGRPGRRRLKACPRCSDSAPPRSAPPGPALSSAGRSDKEKGH